MANKLPPGRVLPPNFKHVVEQPFTLELPFWKRLAFVFGCPVVGKISLWTEHNPGKVRPILSIVTDMRGATNKRTHPVIQP